MLRTADYGPQSQKWRKDQLRVKELVMLISLVFVTITALEFEARVQLCGIRELYRATAPATGWSADVVVASSALQKKAPMEGVLYSLVCKCSFDSLELVSRMSQTIMV